jgi:hypothetical protein
MLVSFKKLVPLPGPVLKPVPPSYRHAYKAYPLLQLAPTFRPPKIEVGEEL